MAEANSSSSIVSPNYDCISWGTFINQRQCVLTEIQPFHTMASAQPFPPYTLHNFLKLCACILSLLPMRYGKNIYRVNRNTGHTVETHTRKKNIYLWKLRRRKSSGKRESFFCIFWPFSAQKREEIREPRIHILNASSSFCYHVTLYETPTTETFFPKWSTLYLPSHVEKNDFESLFFSSVVFRDTVYQKHRENILS